MTDTKTALLYTCVMGAVIFFCRLLAFLLFNDDNSADEPATNIKKKFLMFVEKVAPPAAMTVLAVNAITLSLKQAFLTTGFTLEFFYAAIPVLAAGILCAVLHIIKRNALVSIFSAVIVYMILIRIL